MSGKKYLPKQLIQSDYSYLWQPTKFVNAVEERGNVSDKEGGSYGNKILYKNLKFFDKIFVRNLAVEDFVTLFMGKKFC